MTRPVADVQRALQLHRIGCNNSQIARILGISRTTVREWIHPRYVPRSTTRAGCFRCDDTVAILADQYAYLLGLYLGDGHIAAHPRGVWRLRIFQDARYVDLIEACAQVIGMVSGRRICRVKKLGCVEISAYWKHWIHVFPQHGAGMKYKRVIKLEPWQEEAVTAWPKEFLAGLVHSDGCRSMNTIKRRSPAGVLRVYSYPRYYFTNASDGIRRLFTNMCDALGITWTRLTERNVAISRRPDVEFLDTFIGPKS